MKNSKYSKKAKSFLDGLQQYKDGGMQIPLPEYQNGVLAPMAPDPNFLNYDPSLIEGPELFAYPNQNPLSIQPPMAINPPVQKQAPTQKPNFNAIPVIGSAITLGLGVKEGIESYQAKQRADRLRGYYDQDLAERKRDISLGEYVNTPYSQYQDGGIQLGERVSNFRATDSSQSGTTTGATKMEQAKLSAAQKVENQRILSERKARMERSKAAKSKPYSAQRIADEAAAIPDHFRIFPDDPNSIVDALNPLVLVGDVIGGMAAGLGQVPLNIQEGKHREAAINVAIPVLAGAFGGGNSAAQLVNNLVNPLAGTGLGKGVSKTYRNIATGNSPIPIAWKSPAVGLTEESSNLMFKNLTNSGKLSNAEKALIVEYQHNSSPFTGRFGNIDESKRAALNSIIKKYNLDVADDVVLTRKFNPNNNSLGATIKNKNLDFNDRPTSFSAGVGMSGYGSGAVNRLVIPNRYAKQMGDNFLVNDYNILSDDVINLVEDRLKPFASGIGKQDLISSEREVLGTGLNLKRIGKVKNDIGGEDWIVKPNKLEEGGIHIDPKNKGKFTLEAKRRGMGVQEFANKVMANKEDYSPLLVKRANFAKNAAKWEDGGMYSSVSSDHNTTVELANQRKEQAMELLQKMEEVVQLHKMMYGGEMEEFKSGGQMIKRADGSYSRVGLWDRIRANKGSGKKPTKEMLKQERKIRSEEMEYGGYMPFMDAMDENNQYIDLPEFGNGGYKVERSSDRKGKTHKVTGPDGSVKYFGDPNMGERSKSKYGKEAFYARHKSNLEKNPHFRAYARATWQNGGQFGQTGQVGLEGFGQMYDNQQAYNQNTQRQFEEYYNNLNQQNVANWRNMKTSAINNIVSGVGGLATAAVGMPKLQKGGPVSHTDSIRHQVGKIMKYEKERGSQYGTGLSNYGNPNLRPGATEEEAIDWTMQNILPKVKGAKTAMEKGEAIDFIYNSGKDPRVYAYQEYLRKVDPNNTKGWQDSSGNWKDRKTIPEPQLEMLYNTAIGNMKENDRRVLTNKGRDWYYKNVNVKPDGSPSDAYKNTWYGRIWNTNDYNEFDPNNPKFTPRMQNGGEYDPTLDVNSTQFDANAFLGREEGEGTELERMIQEQAQAASTMDYSDILAEFILEGEDMGASAANLDFMQKYSQTENVIDPSSGNIVPTKGMLRGFDQLNMSELEARAAAAKANQANVLVNSQPQSYDFTPSEGSKKFKNVIDEIKFRESRGKYGVVNEISQTTGAYQFMPKYWADDIRKFMGIDSSASQKQVMEAFRTNPQAQDAFMAHVVDTKYKPQLPKLRPYAQKYGINDDQLIKLMHYRGIGDATKRLKTGNFAVSAEEKAKYKNPDIMEYLKGPVPK